MIKASFSKHILKFNSPGGTSRGVLHTKPSWYLKLWHTYNPDIVGIGEISIIPDLSPESEAIVESALVQILANTEFFINNADKLLKEFPAIRFGLEMALIDLQNGGKRLYFESDFTKGLQGITINGLIWMETKERMFTQIKSKIELGFNCIKIKVGAINFTDELELLAFIRKSFSASSLEIRVDANGAFLPKNAMQKLEALSKFQIHSIEQPIKAGQWNYMQLLCKNSPIPIALDEELIGLIDKEKQEEMLTTIKPQYLIFKPSLLGGFAATKQWSTLAQNNDIKWWLTSALEGNVGLNAIAQWTYLNGTEMPQGLGTGTVFSNNIASPLNIKGDKLWYNNTIRWQQIR